MKHGYARRNARNKIYNSWRGMRARCAYVKHDRYKNYGGRGISVCRRWNSFTKFLADMGPSWEAGLSIDRIDVNKGYFRRNCRWSDSKTQARNKTTSKLIEYKGVRKPLVQWCEDLGLNYGTIICRIIRGRETRDWFKKGQLPRPPIGITRSSVVVCIDGERMNLMDCSKRLGMPYHKLRSRLRLGWSFSEAIKP